MAIGKMKFGIFDHLDRNGRPLAAFYEDRLRLIESYDAGPFHSYHIAEHHATPLGLAPSPSVFLAAVAQRTERLRFGPLVYTLPLHHPLRVAEEICMLDQMSRGRLDVGVGRGVSPFETASFGVDPEHRAGMFAEALAVIKQAMAGGPVCFAGTFYQYDNVPVELEPFQKPLPPLWSGVNTVSSAEVAARNGFQFVTLSEVGDARAVTDRYRDVAAAEGRKDDLMGLGRFVIVADTDEAALDIARQVYPTWHAHYHHLFVRHGTTPMSGARPPEFDQIRDGGRGIAGSPASVARMIREQVAASGTNYFVGQFMFGNLGIEEALTSVRLFTREVVPALA
jgi:alkanesulfonate monooxygenase SsuD/methylene tetrahydromethanopterin reductase-like flavin-dependent oxidoreductase (luciferase family)